MRTIKPEAFEVFELDELEPDAKEKAVEAVAEKLGGDWWDQNDIDDISNAIVWSLANKLGTPGHEKFGDADFPGIPGVTVPEWDADRGTIQARGTLTRENAPALPWTDEMIQVELQHPGHYRGTYVYVESDVEELDLSFADRAALVTRREAMQEAVEKALNAALTAGQEEIEYKTSTEYALEHIEANGLEFYADGRLYA